MADGPGVADMAVCVGADYYHRLVSYTASRKKGHESGTQLLFMEEIKKLCIYDMFQVRSARTGEVPDIRDVQISSNTVSMLQCELIQSTKSRNMIGQTFRAEADHIIKCPQ